MAQEKVQRYLEQQPMDPRTPSIGYAPSPGYGYQQQPGYDTGSMHTESSVFTAYGTRYEMGARTKEELVNEAIREEEGEPQHYYILALFTLLCNPLCSIPAFYFSTRAKAALLKGDLRKAKISGQLALALCVSAIFSGLIIWIFVILYFAVFQAIVYDPYDDDKLAFA